MGSQALFQLRLAGTIALRLLLALAALAVLVLGFLRLLLPTLVYLFQPGEATTSFLRRTGIFASLLLGYWLFVRLHERRKVDELRPTVRGIALGVATGAGLAALAMLLLFALGAYQMTAWQGLQRGLLGVAGLIVVAAMLEEILYRGIVFRILEGGWGTTVALCLQTLLFAANHIANIDGPADFAQDVVTVVAVALVGAFWTLLFVYTRNLWVVCANHAAWNFAILLTGAPLSGIGDWMAVAPLASRYQGPDWLTGGAFGPEASVLTWVLVGAGLVVLWALARSRKRWIPAQRAQDVPIDGLRG